MCTSCADKKYSCELKVNSLFTERGVNNLDTSFTHYLVLTNYEDECFNDTKFVEIANNYLDSVFTDTPVGAIYFTKENPEFDTSGDPDYLNWQENRNKFIISIYYCSKPKTGSNCNGISSIAIWKNGDPQVVYLH